jgi:hypothetical protein
MLLPGAKNAIFFAVFPMFVPSLSWQNDRFDTLIAQKWRFSQDIRRPEARCGKRLIFFWVFPMFVPSLSWQNDAFYI